MLTYHFLILLPKTKQPQPYTVSIRMASRVAVAKRMESEFYGVPPRIFRLMGNRTSVVEVDYIDYMVARNFLNVVDEWFRGIPAAKESKFLQWFQMRSHLIPKVGRFITSIFVGLLLIALMQDFVSDGANDLIEFGRFTGYSLLAVYAAYTLSNWSAGFIEKSLDHYSEVSYLKFTKGDEIEITKAEQDNKFAFIKGVAGLLGTVAVSIITKIIANNLVM